MKIKTANLIGEQLDYAVAKALGFEPYWDDDMEDCVFSHEIAPCVFLREFKPQEWAQGGPIIEQKRIHICPIFYNDYEATQAWIDDRNNPEKSDGPTPLIAAMRCYAASKLGDEVEIPDELCN